MYGVLEESGGLCQNDGFRDSPDQLGTTLLDFRCTLEQRGSCEYVKHDRGYACVTITGCNLKF